MNFADRAREHASHSPVAVLPRQEQVVSVSGDQYQLFQPPTNICELDPGSGNHSAVDLNNRPLLRDSPVRPELVAERAVNEEAAEAPAQAPTSIQPPVLEQSVPVPQHAHHLSRAAGNRKSLAQDCYVCYEPFEGPDDAVWCRRKCGQNLHRACFEEWARNKDRRDVRCGYW